MSLKGRGESGRSNWVKADGPNAQKWTVLVESGRSKTTESGRSKTTESPKHESGRSEESKVDSLNRLEVDGPNRINDKGNLPFGLR